VSDFRRGMFVGAVAVLLGAIVITGLCSAQDWLVVNGLAKHLDGGIHCNSTTSGLGLEHDFTRSTKAIVGFYRNSNCRYSSYAGAGYLPLHVGTVSLGGVFGMVTGYRVSPMPAAAFAASIEGKVLGFNLVLVPPVGDESPGVLWLQGKVRLR
jgi:hypothetical protein